MLSKRSILDQLGRKRLLRLRQHFELEEYLSSGYGIFAGRKVEWATIRFTPLAARWVSAQRWHSKQRARTEADGSYVLEVPYANDQELLMDVLKYGPEAEVIAPEALRRRITEQVGAMARMYGGGPAA